MPSFSVASLEIIDLGRIEYGAARALQKQMASERARGLRPDALLFAEHPPVYTAGTSAEIPSTPLPHPLVRVERGGGITYHGPGQLTGYPIVHLKESGLLVGSLLRLIERALIEAAASFGVSAHAVRGKTGVWTGEDKIASIGIAVSEWVSYHGFALNADLDLAPFAFVKPCGFDPAVMSSLSRRSGRPIGVQDAKAAVSDSFSKMFEEARCIR